MASVGFEPVSTRSPVTLSLTAKPSRLYVSVEKVIIVGLQSVLSDRSTKMSMFIWAMFGGLHPVSPKVRKLEGSRVRRFFSPKVRKLEKKVLESERKGSIVRRSRIPKS